MAFIASVGWYVCVLKILLFQISSKACRLSECYMSMSKSFGLCKGKAGYPSLLMVLPRKSIVNSWSEVFQQYFTLQGTNGTSGTCRGEDETAAAALKILDQYSTILVTMCVSKVRCRHSRRRQKGRKRGLYFPNLKIGHHGVFVIYIGQHMNHEMK